MRILYFTKQKLNDDKWEYCVSQNDSWCKKNFIRDEIKTQRIIMCSSTSYSYSLYGRWAHTVGKNTQCMAVKRWSMRIFYFTEQKLNYDKWQYCTYPVVVPLWWMSLPDTPGIQHNATAAG